MARRTDVRVYHLQKRVYDVYTRLYVQNTSSLLYTYICIRVRVLYSYRVYIYICNTYVKTCVRRAYNAVVRMNVSRAPRYIYGFATFLIGLRATNSTTLHRLNLRFSPSARETRRSRHTKCRSSLSSRVREWEETFVRCVILESANIS